MTLPPSPRLLIAGAIILTILALAGIVAVSQPPPVWTPDPAPVAANGPWAGWLIDEGWTVDGDTLVGDAPSVPAWDLDTASLRYAIAPPSDVLTGDYALSFNLAFASTGTLYLGLFGLPEEESGLPCRSLVFPLQERLSGLALAREACGVAGVQPDTAVSLDRPLIDVTEFGFPPEVRVEVTEERVRLFLERARVYDISYMPEAGAGSTIYLALGPAARARISEWVVAPGEAE